MASTSSDNDKKPTNTSPLDNEKADGTNAPVSPPYADESTLAILELVKAQDAHHPIHWPAWKRWSIITLYCTLQLFVTMTSTSYSTYSSDQCIVFWESAASAWKMSAETPHENPAHSLAALSNANSRRCTVGIEFLIQERWGGSTQVVTLGQSLFIIGTAVGPAFMGPLS